MSEVVESMSSQDALKLLGAMQTAIEATTSSAAPLLTKYVLFLSMHSMYYDICSDVFAESAIVTSR